MMAGYEGGTSVLPVTVPPVAVVFRGPNICNHEWQSYAILRAQYYENIMLIS